MSIGYDPRDPRWQRQRDRADTVEWTRVSAQMTELVGQWARRPDLVAVVEPGVGKGAAAVYVPEMAHVEIDPEVCAQGEDPADIDLDGEAGRLRHAPLVGAGRHEAAHGDLLFGSHWPIDSDPARRAVVAAALLLEESRIERWAVRSDPGCRVFLRAAFHAIVNRAPDVSTVVGAAHAAALAGGRVDAGVLDAAEAAPVMDAAAARLGAGTVQRLRGLWLEGQALQVPSVEQMEELGRRWVEVLREAGASEEELSGMEVVLVCSVGDGESGDGESGDGGVLAVVAGAVSADAGVEAGQRAREVRRAEAAAAAEAEGREAGLEAAAAQGLLRGAVVHAAGGGGEGLAALRDPSGAEVAEAVVLAGRLRRAQYREYSVAVRAAAVPPGRLRGARAMRRSAQVAVGVPPTALPWDRVRRGFVERPPVRVGIGCDISGSMDAVVGEAASVAWSVASAVHRCDGDVAAVAYGAQVHPFVLPGEVPRQVREFAARGGSEDWAGAVRALSGSLRLRDIDGVRLLVFLSDGHYKGTQKADGEALLRRLVAGGVKVLWVGFRGRGPGRLQDDVPEWLEYVRVDGPGSVGAVVGDRLVELLERA